MNVWLLVSALLLQIPTPRSETGVITGTVRQADGKTAAAVRVAAMPADSAVAPGAGSALVALTQTDESGNFRLDDVPPGRYYIVAGRVDAPTFYPGTTDRAGGRIVAVSAGATIDGIDFTVTAESLQLPQRGGLIQILPLFQRPADPPVPVVGRIVMDEASKGAKLPERFAIALRISSGVRLQDGSMGTRTVQASVTPAPDGSFGVGLLPGPAGISIIGLPAGYSVKSMTSGGTDLLSRSAVIQQGMAEIVIVLAADTRPRFVVSGTVVDSITGRPLLGEPIELVSESGTNVRILIDAQGRFEFRVLPGSHVLRVNSPRFNPIEQTITLTDSPLNVELRAVAR